MSEKGSRCLTDVDSRFTVGDGVSTHPSNIYEFIIHKKRPEGLFLIHFKVAARLPGREIHLGRSLCYSSISLTFAKYFSMSFANLIALALVFV
jgi:hypothetical protein